MSMLALMPKAASSVESALLAIDKLREKAGLTKQEAMRKADLPASSLYAWQKGENTPSFESIDALARAVGGLVLVVSREDAQRHTIAHLTTPEGVAIAGMIAHLSDEQRQRISALVAQMVSSLPVEQPAARRRKTEK